MDEMLERIITKDKKKKFGGSFCIPMSEYKDEDRGIVRTFPSWDCILGGGFLRGQLLHIHAVDKIGKTTFCFQVAQRFKEQFPNTIVFYYKVENRLSSHMFEGLEGCDNKNFYVIQSSEDKILTGQDFLQILESNIIDFPESVHIFDSVGGIVGTKEYEGNIGDCQVAEVARLMQTTLKKISPLLPIRKATVFFINHEKQSVNTMGYGGPRTTTPGGSHLRYQADTVLRLTFSSAKMDGASKDIVDASGEKIGHNVTFNVETTIMGKPKGKVYLPLIYGRGFDYKQDVINFAKNIGLIDQSASWFSYKDLKFQGIDKFMAEIEENNELFLEIEKEVREQIDGMI